MTNEIGGRIREARERRGMSQAHLAEAAGLDVRTVRRIERGETVPSSESLLGICSVLQLEAEEILRGTNANPKSKPKAVMVFVSDGHALLQNLVGYHDGSIDADDAGDDEDAASLVKEVLQAFELAEVLPDLEPDRVYEQGRQLSKTLKALESKGWVVAVVKQLGMTIEYAGKSVSNWNRVTLMIKNAKKFAELDGGKSRSI